MRFSDLVMTATGIAGRSIAKNWERNGNRRESVATESAEIAHRRFTPPMNKNLFTIMVDLGILLALLAIAFGLWFYPWITLLVIALLMLGGCLTGEHSK